LNICCSRCAFRSSSVGGFWAGREPVGDVSAAILASSASLRRVANGVSTGLTSRISALVNTILPASLPRNFSRSASVFASKCTTSAVTAPFVDGDHAFGNPINGDAYGSITSAEKDLNDQPRPKGPHGSSFAFCIPHFAIVSRDHSLARFMFGELVSLGPMTSVK
jgi:hypothetical protein